MTATNALHDALTRAKHFLRPPAAEADRPAAYSAGLEALGAAVQQLDAALVHFLRADSQQLASQACDIAGQIEALRKRAGQ